MSIVSAPPIIGVPAVSYLIKLPVDIRRLQCCSILIPVSLSATHRVTPNRFRELRAAQDGVCGICKLSDAHIQGDPRSRGSLRPLFIDHDHMCCHLRSKTCGDCIRGLLCNGCNVRLGRFEFAATAALREGYIPDRIAALMPLSLAELAEEYDRTYTAGDHDGCDAVDQVGGYRFAIAAREYLLLHGCDPSDPKRVEWFRANTPAALRALAADSNL